tara:strand:+ start:8274 stop:8594 length:321 start_codon:yes stop_codon:yes gene_type:complete
MRKDSTIDYGRRNKDGVKTSDIKDTTWTCNITDFRGDREHPFTQVSVHANGGSWAPAEVAVRSFTDHSDPFYVVDIGNGIGVNVFLTPAQARTLAVSLAEATGMMN